MSKGDKYIGLRTFLKNSNKTIVKLTFSEIENLIEDTLPNSAYRYPAWWSNNEDHSEAISWLDAGYRTEQVSETILDRNIIFIKTS